MSPPEVSKGSKLFQTLPAAQALRNYNSYCELSKYAPLTGPKGPEVWLPCTQVGPRAGGVPSWSLDMPQNCYGSLSIRASRRSKGWKAPSQEAGKIPKGALFIRSRSLSHQKPPFTVGFLETVPSRAA